MARKNAISIKLSISSAIERSKLIDICGHFVYIIDEVIIMAETRSSGMHIRVNPEIKAKAEPILAAIGLSFKFVSNAKSPLNCPQYS
jgi:hypothetical protein